MIIVAGTMTVDPDNRDRVMDLARAVMTATRQEDGCHEYVFSPDPDDPGLIRLYELWESRPHLDAHFRTPHIAEWRRASEDLLNGRSIKLFTIERFEDL